MRSPQVRAQSFSPSIRLSATFTGLASNRFGLQFEVQPHPVTPALYVISIRRTRDLPTDFFFSIRLPSDSTSRWTPLPSAIRLARLTRVWDFHP